jgi:hypothetical protein
MTEALYGFHSPSEHDRIVPTSSPCSHLSTCFPLFIIPLDVSTELLTGLLNKLYIIVSPGNFSDLGVWFLKKTIVIYHIKEEFTVCLSVYQIPSVLPVTDSQSIFAIFAH